MFDSAQALVYWLSAVTVFGTITSFILVGHLFRDTKCRWPGIVVGVLACFAVHLPLTWGLVELVIRIWQVPLREAETVGYYVGPAVFVFVSLPVGAIVCRWWSRCGSAK